ncbi:hypothetical protein GGX14DRAFT_562549 [Mycena pura]|uniref:Uncharacterized protein n=1 Tax=Mycena pura TaxID=153505 RepID=A0AAD6VLH0_9AGAR|nr:hypothetical protein GGX14DRAFT_562549 [Mycena pura]
MPSEDNLCPALAHPVFDGRDFAHPPQETPAALTAPSPHCPAIAYNAGTRRREVATCLSMSVSREPYIAGAFLRQSRRASSQPLLCSCSFGIPGNEDDYAVRRPRTRTSSLSTYRTLTPTPTPTSTSTHATNPSAASSRAAAAALWVLEGKDTLAAEPEALRQHIMVLLLPSYVSALSSRRRTTRCRASAGSRGDHSADVPRGGPCARCVAREHGRGCGCGAARMTAMCAAGVTVGTQAGARMAGRTHGRAAASGARDSVDPGVDVYRIQTDGRWVVRRTWRWARTGVFY